MAENVELELACLRLAGALPFLSLWLVHVLNRGGVSPRRQGASA
jgi:hypothetical protein